MKKRQIYSQIETSLDFIHESIEIVQDHQNAKYFLSHTDKQGLKARDHLFSLEGLLRLHLKTYSFNHKKEVKHAQNLLSILKEFEDLIGLLSLQIELKNKSDEVNQKMENIDVFKFLKTKWNLQKITEYKKKFRKLSFKSKKKHIKVIIGSEINRIKEKSDSLEKYIMSSPYNIEKLELGFHEWRRAIRWISIYLQFYKKDFSLIEQTKTKPNRLILTKFKNSPFMNFAKNDKTLIPLNLTKYYLLSFSIYKSGTLKEKVEENLFLNKKSSLFVENACKKIYNQFKEYNILEDLLI